MEETEQTKGVDSWDTETIGAVKVDKDDKDWVHDRQVAIMQVALGMLYQAALEYPIKFTIQQSYQIVSDYVKQEYTSLNKQLSQPKVEP